MKRQQRPLLPDKDGVPKYRFRIQRVGVELEGAWKRDRFDTFSKVKGWKYKEEVSSTVKEFDVVGEIISEPMIRKDVWPWMRAFYPQGTNRTCGIHVHMSFRHKSDYERLMDRRYHEHLLRGFVRFGHTRKIDVKHPFWERLTGRNAFCKDFFDPDAQAHYDGHSGGQRARDHRFAAVNYCFAQHKTLEYRVLPTFEDPTVAIRAVRRLLNLTEEYLHTVETVFKETGPSLKAIVGIPVIEKKSVETVRLDVDPFSVRRVELYERSDYDDYNGKATFIPR